MDMIGRDNVVQICHFSIWNTFAFCYVQITSCVNIFQLSRLVKRFSGISFNLVKHFIMVVGFVIIFPMCRIRRLIGGVFVLHLRVHTDIAHIMHCIHVTAVAVMHQQTVQPKGLHKALGYNSTVLAHDAFKNRLFRLRVVPLHSLYCKTFCHSCTSLNFKHIL